MAAAENTMTLIKCIIKGERLPVVQDGLEKIGVVGMTAWEVKGHGRQKGHIEHYRGLEIKVNLLPKVMIEIVVPDTDVEQIVNVLIESARTGEIGDGKIFLLPVRETIRIRTGDRGLEAI
jgi:nitrogen regulatory protein P-II 1